MKIIVFKIICIITGFIFLVRGYKGLKKVSQQSPDDSLGKLYRLQALLGGLALIFLGIFVF